MTTVYQNFAEILSGGRDRNKRTIKGPRATFLTRKQNHVITLTYQNTEVITASKTGRVILDSGGWRTVTTKSRINEYGPAGFYLSQAKGIWTLTRQDQFWQGSILTKRDPGSFTFRDGIMINENTGRVSNFGDPKKDLQLRKDLKKYVSSYYTAMERGSLGIAPGPGDCFMCLCAAQGGSVIDPRSEHLRSHIDESYLVPSLGINVLREGYSETPTIGSSLSKLAAYSLQETLRTGDPISNDFGIVKRQVKRAMMKYIGSRIGVVA